MTDSVVLVISYICACPYKTIEMPVVGAGLSTDDAVCQVVIWLIS